MEQKFIVIKNFDEHQHYSNRNMVWIKLYVKLLRSDKFFYLIEEERWIYIGLLLLAAVRDNKVLYDLNFIKVNICNFNFPQKRLEEIIRKLEEIGMIAIKMIAGCYQNAIDNRIEENRREENRTTEVKTSEDVEEDKHIVKILNSFKKTVNPTINFGHKTNRQAIRDLLKLCKGNFETLMGMVEFAISVQGRQFAPVITTPYQLKEKLGALKIYADRQNKKVEIMGL